ncbi:MBL fold metallo-hydrolase [Pedobacter antarcticus]|uniref:MBL fold metallo-hydrolase n=1 Tax=Pedobacter antarcticus TaxID=34086 RepID=UPI002931050C|nr:MBL fold metallo-hydrolase [Pedobacter antarcticus]
MVKRGLINLFILGGLVLTTTYCIGQVKQLTYGSPEVQIDRAYKLSKSITIIPDPRINYVPNIGIIEGENTILVVDAGMGPKNGKRVFDYANSIAKGRKIYLTTTHFHPEHSFGAMAFNNGGATVLMNQLQADELKTKGEAYLNMFKRFGDLERKVLEGTKIAKVDELYSGRKILDLGNKKVEFYELPAHTLGDQVIFVPDDGVIFMGDLVEDRFFPIMPDSDSRPSRWIEVMREVSKLNPETVVPGHGELGGIELITNTESYLNLVKSEVKLNIDKGLNKEAILEVLTPKLKHSRSNWDNAVFIQYEIAHFYAEWTNTIVVLPDLTDEQDKYKQ